MLLLEEGVWPVTQLLKTLHIPKPLQAILGPFKLC